MATFKSAKRELIAIYRLEFYKNKKNWKLCQDVRKTPPRSQSPRKCKSLNVTYDVEVQVAEQDSLHNKAFLLEEPDADAQPPSDPEPYKPLCQHSWLEQDQPWIEESEAVWQDAQQEFCGVEAEGGRDFAFSDECDGPCNEHDLWPPISQCAHLQPPCDLQQLEYLSPTELLQTAEQMIHSRGYNCQEYEDYYDQYTMVDNDSTEFVRGAHIAPHSSETDLSIANDECECISSRALCYFSSRQLSSAINRHSTALRHLLVEHTLRDKLICESPIPSRLQFDYPTRDTDPLHSGDPVVAGSHLSHLSQLAHLAQDEGRGRGRLRRERVVGIEMGRPYRLNH